MQCGSHTDVVSEIIKLLKEDGIIKSRDSVIQELFKQNAINKDEYEKLVKGETDRNSKIVQVNKKMRDDEIGKLCEQLTQDGKLKFLEWVQKVLLDTCFAKICLKKKSRESEHEQILYKTTSIKPNTLEDINGLSPVSYHSLSKCITNT